MAVGQELLPLVANWEGGCRKQLNIASQRVNHSSLLSIVPSYFLFFLHPNMLPHFLPFGACLVLILMQYSGTSFSLCFSCPPSRLILSPTIQYSARVSCISILWSWKAGQDSFQHPSMQLFFFPIGCRVIGDSLCDHREECLFSWCSLLRVSHEGGSLKEEDWIWWGFWLLSFSHCLDPPQAMSILPSVLPFPSLLSPSPFPPSPVAVQSLLCRNVA